MSEADERKKDGADMELADINIVPTDEAETDSLLQERLQAQAEKEDELSPSRDSDQQPVDSQSTPQVKSWLRVGYNQNVVQMLYERFSVVLRPPKKGGYVLPPSVCLSVCLCVR